MGDRVVAMRADFEQLVAAGGWAADDAMEMGLAIKAGIEANDEGLVLCWANWLAAEAAQVRRGETVRPTERPTDRQCRTCSNTRRPGTLVKGETEAMYCGRRIDLPPAYGEGHPLRRLPADRGASCAEWRAA